jgi:hypothetical protein
MTALGWLDWPQRGDRPWAEVINEVHARTGTPDLLTLQRMFDAAGADGRELVWSAYSASWGCRVGRDWADDQVWPFVAHNLDWLLDEASSRQGWDIDEHAVFAAIATLPEPPARLTDRLYALAVGPRKSDRAPARAALKRDPQRTARAAAALQDGKSDVPSVSLRLNGSPISPIRRRCLRSEPHGRRRSRTSFAGLCSMP